jgi:membrane protein implicated in regulation of membrane protease activity
MLNNAWSFIVTWYNLPFTILLVLAGVFAVLQLVGLGGEADQDADADVDADADIDADADVDIHADVDTDADVSVDHDLDLDHDVDLAHDADLDHDADVDHDVDHDAGLEGAPNVLTLLAFVGMGKAPLAVVLLILFGAIGLLGWILNSLVLSLLGAYPGIAFAAIAPLSLVTGGLISSRISRLIGRALPPVSTTAMRAQALVGRSGTVISPYVDAKYGMVHLRDQGGTLISVFAVNPSEQVIKRGCEVVLVSYDEAKRHYTVAPLNHPQ